MWSLRLTAAAHREFSRLPSARLSEEAGDLIEDLAEDPFPSGYLKMRRYSDHYRIRFGGDRYRIVYRVNLRQRMITILRIRPRSSAYRGMRDS